jgi:hypothetical protein
LSRLNLKKHLPNLLALTLGLFVGMGMYLWSLWQHDMLCAPRMGDFYTGVFEFFTGVRVSVGFAYNVTLLLQTVGVLIAIVSAFVAAWYWPNE